mmetsp:Transcript_7356/g.11074  ORF Transcript_7356/g.11074 Transcript_7356/m.11074 type:complete len:235 (-) Transcript_7356:885-1589(-)
MIRIEPPPRNAPPVIVSKTPLQTFNVSLSQGKMSVNMEGSKTKFFIIVPPLEILGRMFRIRIGSGQCPSIYKFGIHTILRNHVMNHGFIFALLGSFFSSNFCIGWSRGLSITFIPLSLLYNILCFTLLLIFKNLRFRLSNNNQEFFQPICITDIPRGSQVLSQTPGRTLILICIEEKIKGSISNIERWHVWQEIISNQECNECKVINNSFQIVCFGIKPICKFNCEVFSENGQM